MLTNNIRELFAKNSPVIWKTIGKTGLTIQKDPFGKYYNSIVFIGNSQPCSMSEFAEYFSLSPGTATGIVDKLVSLEVIKRENNPDDRRKVELILDDLGQNIYDEAKKFEAMLIKQLLSDLSEEDVKFATKIMKKLNTNNLFNEFR